MSDSLDANPKRLLAGTPRRSAAWCALVIGLSTISAGCGGGRVSAALNNLTSADVTVRRQAAQTLFELRPPQEPVVSALTQAVNDSDSEVRRWVCRTLGELGEIASPSVPVLEGALKDSETAVRRSAAFALQRLAPDSKAYRLELSDAMLDGDGGVIVALPKLSPKPDWAIPSLVKLLKDRRPGTRRLAAEALGEIGISSTEVQPALETAAAKDADDRVRESAAHALQKILASGLQSASPNGKL
ncbi:MAG: HEAT repeat domain-containing protein [Planctomycetaceae bacterium]|nr:HEAT repeat domain-containing protein [Planctomycetaceae bacterium]